MDPDYFKTKEEFVEKFKARTKTFAVDVIKLCKELPKNPSSRVISYQIIKSASSVAANYRAACRARSNKEFYAKLCIVVEEADESEFWIDLLIEAELLENKTQLENLHKESIEIMKIVSSARKKAKGRL